MKSLNKLKCVLFSISFMISSICVYSQDFEALIQKAWMSNNMLKSKEFSLIAAEQELKEAKAMYGPDVHFNLQYMLAKGGRVIEFPVGDLMNPAYLALNKLTNSNQFPTIENEKINFIPNNFYDAKLSVSQAIYYPDLAINKGIKQLLIYQKELEIKAYKRLLAKEIILSSINLETAKIAKDIYLSTDTLLQEVKRTTQSMIKNGIALPSSLHRIESQISTLSAQSIQADANIYAAQAYLDYFVHEEKFNSNIALKDLPNLDIKLSSQKEEVLQIENSLKSLQLLEKKEANFYKPILGAQLDLGSQEFDFGFQPYALLGLNLRWNLYDSKKHNIRYEEARAQKNALMSQKQFLDEQFDMQTKISENNLLSAIAQAKTYQTRITTAQKLYKEIFLKYKEGSAGYLEIIDAQTELTNILLQHNLARNHAWTKWAEYQYVSCALEID